MTYRCAYLDSIPSDDFQRQFDECKHKIDEGNTLPYPENVTTDTEKHDWLLWTINRMSKVDNFKIIGYWDDDLLFAMTFGIKNGDVWNDRFSMFGKNKAGSRSYLYDRDNWAQVINAFLKAEGMTKIETVPLSRAGTDVYLDTIPTLRDDQSITRVETFNDLGTTYAKSDITL